MSFNKIVLCSCDYLFYLFLIYLFEKDRGRGREGEGKSENLTFIGSLPQIGTTAGAVPGGSQEPGTPPCGWQHLGLPETSRRTGFRGLPESCEPGGSCRPSSPAFPGPLAGSWIGNSSLDSRCRSDMGCACHKCPLGHVTGPLCFPQTF